MEVEIGLQPDVVQQQQIQAFLANVEELTRQNEELQKTMESQNAKRRRTGENQNEEEWNSQANRQDRTSGEDSTRMENEEGGGRTKKCYEGQRRRKSGWDDSKDRLTLHY